MDPVLNNEEKKVEQWMIIRRVIQYLVAFIGCFGGLGLAIFASDSGANINWEQFLMGMIMVGISVVAVLTFGPWTKEEKELDAKLNPTEE